MKNLLTAAALAVTLLLAACDSAGGNEDTTPVTPPSIITGFYIVVDAPAASTVSYVVTEYNAGGMVVQELDPVVLEISAAGARVLDLYQKGTDPAGVSITAKLTAGTGTLRVELWQDDAMESSAQTERLYHGVCVTGGSCGH